MDYSYVKTEGSFKSSNNKDRIAYYIYTPTVCKKEHTLPKAIVQISHGMCEYIERYGWFIDFLTRNGILVCGNDHLGHKGSVSSKDNLGYFAPKKGYTYLAKDLHTLTELVKKKYVSTPIPYFLFGHSMGSFAARDYITQFGNELQGVILCGTSKGQSTAGAGIALANTIQIFNSERFRSPFLHNLAFGSYNKKYTPKRTEFDWLSKDTQIVDRYAADPYCNFVFTTRGFNDLFHLLQSVTGKKWACKLPKDLPIDLIGGEMDPVGDYGKGVQEVYSQIKAAGVKDVSIKLYAQDRHEILNETDKDVVAKDILDWIISKT